MEENILLTEELRKKYDLIKLNILHQNSDYRTSLLVDRYENPKSMAVCVFSKKPFSKGLKSIHEKIKKGGLIGETIKGSGYDVIKTQLCRFNTGTPEVFKTPGIEKTNGLLYVISAKSKDGQIEIYGTLCEISHPEFSLLEPSHSEADAPVLLRNMLKHLNLETSKINVLWKFSNDV